MGSDTLSSACYILSDESSIPFYSTSNGYKNTIDLVKIDVFNTNILNNEYIKEILKRKQKPVIIADLMDITVFKSTPHKELLIIYIKQPIVKNRCEIYYARSVSQSDGKLLISNQVAKCSNIFYEMFTFKKILFYNYCTLNLEKLVLPDY